MADVSDPKIAEGMCLNPPIIFYASLTLLLQIAYEQIRSNGGEETWMLLDYEVRIQNNVVIIRVYFELTFFLPPVLSLLFIILFGSNCPLTWSYTVDM